MVEIREAKIRPCSVPARIFLCTYNLKEWPRSLEARDTGLPEGVLRDTEESYTPWEWLRSWAASSLSRSFPSWLSFKTPKSTEQARVQELATLSSLKKTRRKVFPQAKGIGVREEREAVGAGSP